MVYLKKLWAWITWPYNKIKDEIRLRKRLKKLREQDPYIYK